MTTEIAETLSPQRQECEPVPARPCPDAALGDAVAPNRSGIEERRSVRRMTLFLIADWIAIAAVLLARDETRNTICSIPLAMSLCDNSKSHDVYVQVPPFQDIVVIQSGFKPLLDLSGYGIFLARDIKRLEVAVGDLSGKVKYSDLKSKDGLSQYLGSFAGTLKAISRHLLRWDATVIGAVDSFINMEYNVIRTLEYFEQDERLKSSKSISHSSALQEQTRAQMIEKFDELSSSLKRNIQKLRVVSVSTEYFLERAEAELANIHEVVIEEEGYTRKKKNEVLADISAWTRPKAQEMSLFETHEESDLLSKVEGIQTAAADQVAHLTVQLDAMEMAIDALRDQFDTPVPRGNTSIPLELYIGTLKAGFIKLEESKLRARIRQDRVLHIITDGPQDPEIS